ncbi:hypothetical protein Trydic_g21897 [Trypoxylus dichotomus]
MQRHTTTTPLPTPMEASGRSDDIQTGTTSQLAAKLPAHQYSPGHRQDCRMDYSHQAARGNGRPRCYPQLPIRVPQRAQHHSPSAAHRRTDQRRLQPTAGISKAMVRLIHSFLRKRTFKIKLEGQRSTSRTATAGVPQGSPLSPLLFSIDTSDIPTTAHVNLAMYADDVCISSAVLFSIGGRRRRKHGNPAELTFQGGIIPRRHRSKEASFLGNKSDTWESR